MSSHPAVTVCIPAWKAHDTIERAVRSVLAQTFEDFLLVVASDGDPDLLEAIAHIDDERLMRVEHPVNRGRYAVDHDMVAACQSHWWAPFDADDWADPDWLEQLLAVSDGADVVLADHFIHPISTGPPKRAVALEWNGTPRFLWHGHMAGLWRAEWVREHRITNPHVRVAWDSYMTGAAFVLGNVRICREARYHRVRRANSLTTSKETGYRSAYRNEITPKIREAWERLVADPSSARGVVAGFVPKRGATDIIADTKLFSSGWPLNRSAAAELDAALWNLQPRMVLEAGSGHSTLICARYAKATGAKVVSLKHHERFHRQTTALLRRFGLHNHVDLRLAPLDGERNPWYQTDLPDGIDFALIDGPPEREGGRRAALPKLWPHLARQWELWLDDVDRPGERAALASWQEQLGVAVETVRSTGIVRPSPPPAPLFDAGDVFVSVLTGRRPDLLARTLGSLPPDLLASARSRIEHTGAAGDEATFDVIDQFGHLFDVFSAHQEMRSIGKNMSALAEAAQVSGCDYWLHLEDDWLYEPTHHGWLDDARSLLEDPTISQVRLRHISEPVLARSMVSRRPVVWKPHAEGLAAEAHLTFNPSLVRVADIAKMYPAAGETEMQARAFKAGMRRVAQASPGAWFHIGGDASLRQVTGCVT